MKNKFRGAEMERLYQAVLSLQNLEECYAFFEDLCTVSELKALAQRLEVAKMLKDQITYQEICEKTGASTTTISRVNRALQYGEDGYNMILERLGEEK